MEKKMKKPNFKNIFSKFKKIRISKRFVIDAIQNIVILAVFAGLGIWYAYGSRAGSSERFAMKYFEYFLTGNYEKMYEMSDVTESIFVDKDQYINVYECNAIMGGIKEYDISKPKKENGLYVYTISYTKRDDTKGEFIINLEKQPERTYLLFNTWKVNVDNLIIDKYTIGIPSDMEGKIDGIDLADYYDNTSLDGGMKYYVLYRMLSGEHSFTITGENIDTYNTTVYVEPDDTEMEFALESFSMVPSEEDEVLDYSKYVINQIYEHALQDAPFTDIEELFATSERRRSAIGYLYDSIVEWSVGEDGAKLETFSIDRISSTVQKYTYAKEVAVKVSYKYSYEALAGRTMVTANQDVLTGEGKAEAVVYFRRDSKKKWKIIRIEMELPNYTEVTEEE